MLPDSILERIETFRRNFDSYISSGYKETELRREFLDPFFESLGWDIANRNGLSETYKDVVHEDTLRVVGAATTAPDYSFRTGGVRRFFVEAKKPAVRIKENAAAAFQLRSYSWSAKLPVGIVTDFHEFAVYDTRVMPKEADKASTARIFYCRFDEYPAQWKYISENFSKEALLSGAFDKYVAEVKGKRGTAQFDDAFLDDMERWREILARSIAVGNRELSQRQLNFAVQRILDRIIFLRIAEDRGVEPYGQLKKLLANSSVYKQLCTVFERADVRYNSGIFHFEAEKGREEEPDGLTLQLKVADAPLKEIVSSLYFPKSPYAFAVVPAELLGNVYEQFLGKVIHLTEAHEAEVIKKPEVRYAGGVYYTPTYVVEYIIGHTLASLLKGKTPKDAAEIKVLDPACGSGSFLLEAFSFLLRWHLDYYVNNKPETWAKKRTPPLYQAAGDGAPNWQLTTLERKRILLSSIFGVDIDAQAVEVTKLSLLLKVLEGEAREQKGKQVDFYRVLPDLGNNIKCGNSLIEPNFYKQQDLPAFDEEGRIKINAFNWSGEFPAIVERGGFDAVIGNPPYIFARELISEPERAYYRTHYPEAEDKQNTFVLFIRKLLDLTKSGGRSGFIVPNSLLTVESCAAIRRLLIPHLIDLVDCNYPVFNKVSLEPAIFVIRKGTNSAAFSAARITDAAQLTASDRLTLSTATVSQPQMRLVFGGSVAAEGVLEKLAAGQVLATRGFDVRTGLQAYERGRGTPKQTASDVENHIYDRSDRLDDSCHRYLEGGDVGRYKLSWSGMWMSWGPWLSQPRELAIFQRPRLLIREITAKPPRRLYAAFTNEDFLSNKSVITILHHDDDEDELRALLGLLNSKVISFYYQGRAVKGARKLFPKIVINNLREFPLPPKWDAAKISGKVAEIMSWQERLGQTRSPEEQVLARRSIQALDEEIDELVYSLYGVSSEQRKQIEESLKP